MSKAAVRWCLPVVLLLALAACSGSGQTHSVSVAGTAADAQPSTENTAALEKPQQPRGGNPGIEVATLPVGGAPPAPESPEPGTAQCLTVGWSPSSGPKALTPGVSVEVLDVTIEGYDTGTGCPGAPCADHVFSVSDSSCDVSLTPTDESKTERGAPEVPVKVSGQVLCTDPGGASCRAFEDALKGGASDLSVPAPIAPGTSPDQAPPQTTTGSGASNAPETSGTSPGP